MLAAIIAISLAFIGYLATHVNGVRLAQRQERLSRINRQLAEFYGPLLALVQSNRRLFEELTRTTPSTARSLHIRVPSSKTTSRVPSVD